MNVFCDIETLPTEDDETIAVLRESAKAPANLVDPKKIAAAKETAFDKAWKNTALNGTYGTIACIAWAVEDSDIYLVSLAHSVNEKAMLLRFFDLISNQLLSYSNTRLPWFIGHNISFDLRFLWHRAVIHGIRPPFKIPYNATPWSNKYTCTMYEWCGAKEFIKLKELCRVLGIDDSGDIDGADVYSEWKAGNHEKVIEHCRADVERVRAIYRRICL